MTTRVILVDDPAERAALEGAGCHVLAAAGGGGDLRRRVIELRPDVVLVDIESGQRDVLGRLAQRSERSDRYPRPVVLLGGTRDPDALAAGGGGLSEYGLLTGDARAGEDTGVPPPSLVLGRALEELTNPF